MAKMKHLILLPDSDYAIQLILRVDIFKKVVTSL